MILSFTTDYYWDCECEDDYIHPQTQEYCPICDKYSHEQPDSRTEEVMLMLRKGLNARLTENI
jgi:hypothetical protein